MGKHIQHSPELLAAYAEYDRQTTIGNFKVACVIGILLMPAGIILDWFMYRDFAPLFFEQRLICSLLIGLFLALLLTETGKKHYRVLGIILFMLPASFIAWMIYYAQRPESVFHQAASPYYAGLNLVFLVLAFVLHWTFRESLTAATLVLLLYLAACLFSGLHIIDNKQITGAFVNNLYFLTLTGIIVVAGSYFHSKARFREFALSYQVERDAKKLEETNQKLLEMDQLKSRFFANISHELRTPLTLLIAPLETLLGRFRRDEQTRDLLTTMQSNGMRLLKLINDLLDLVRLESGRMQVKSEPVEVAEFVRSLASAARQVATDKRLQLQTEIDPQLGTVLIDRDKLEKIALNLVFNAIKFTPAGGVVRLAAQKQGAELVVIVADSGMGIAAKNLPYVFDRFWQADGSSQRKYQGVGIGLALVKELVEIQGGTVAVQSEEGKGATFTVRFPYQRAELPRPVETSAEVPTPDPSGTVTSEEWLANLYRRAELFPALTSVQDSLRPVEAKEGGRAPTVLVADDEPDMLRFIRNHLSAQYRVLEAVDGQQAIEKAGQFLPDLIILDMMMPQKDGLEACRAIRERSSTQSIPVILLTARADEETKLAALSAGASDFITKPFSLTELSVRIQNLVRSHDYQHKLSKQNQVLETTIEQLKDTETQLVQSEKLASLGRLSAGIIHEINNPLNFASSGLYTLRKRAQALPDGERREMEEILQDVEDGIKRVKDIVTGLRGFTHPDTSSREQVDVNEVIASALRFLSNEWKGKVLVESSVSSGQIVQANKNNLIHVLVNLLQNSLDALKTKHFDTGQPTIWIRSEEKEGRTSITIRDNGTGINQEHLDKIFDPFFTTKEIGAGMGLGLSICYRIIQQYDGRISVRTEPGQWTEFRLDFAAAPAPQPAEQPAPSL